MGIFKLLQFKVTILVSGRHNVLEIQSFQEARTIYKNIHSGFLSGGGFAGDFFFF